VALISAAERRSALAQVLFGRGIGSQLSSESQFRDRYRIFKEMAALTLDIYYDNKGRITGVEPGVATTAIALLTQAVAAIEQLPAELLRPRFADRPRSSLALIALHIAALETADLRAAGVRLAQFELAYDIEAAGPPTAEPPVKLTIYYNRRGDITWHRLTSAEGSVIAAGALAALGLVPGPLTPGPPTG
jgi:hypothetical protein